jgi:Ala-tRNA(Pro) deacylase
MTEPGDENEMRDAGGSAGGGPAGVGSDADGAALPTTPEALLERLDGLSIAYSVHHHPPLRTVDDSKALRGDLPGGHCKNLFLRDKKGRMWLVVTLEDRAVDLKALGALLSARLSFGSADRLLAALGVLPGAVTPFAMINDTERSVTIVLDRALLAFERLNYHPLVNTMTIGVSPADLLRFLADRGHEPLVVDMEGPNMQDVG